MARWGFLLAFGFIELHSLSSGTAMSHSIVPSFLWAVNPKIYLSATVRHKKCNLSAAAVSDHERNDEFISTSSQIRGCTIERVADSLTTWTITIDGIEADLGKFSSVIYRKITSDAKRERFQGFRPGTIPPHLQPTYRAFAMDEAAREATLEAMEQNNIRPFENARADIVIEKVSISPPQELKKKKKKKKKKRSQLATDKEPEPDPIWKVYENMKGAIDAGWQPGQNFSFVAKNVKGQEIKSGAEKGTKIGSQGVAFDLNQVAANAARNNKQGI